MELILVQMLCPGMSRSREKAKTVLPNACYYDSQHEKRSQRLFKRRRLLTMAVKQTNLMMMNPQTVKKMPPALPRLL